VCSAVWPSTYSNCSLSAAAACSTAAPGPGTCMQP
jgi:hypothetical protein